MRKFIPFFLTILVFSCTENKSSQQLASVDIPKEKKQISFMLDSFNVTAAQADYEAYFNFFSDDAIYIGTDATENWSKAEFMIWAKPHFDKKKTWDFKSIQRNIYFGNQPDIAWFDELLNTQMKICRGSGVVVKQNNEWKVRQYVLSMTIPNEKSDEVVNIKAEIDDSLINVIGRQGAKY